MSVNKLYVNVDGFHNKTLSVPSPSQKTLCLQAHYAKDWNSAGHPLIVEYEIWNDNSK